MDLSEAILVVLLHQPVYEEDRAAASGATSEGCVTEACTERLELFGQVASAIAEVAMKGESLGARLELVAAEITVGYFESHFAVYVLKGQCTSGKFKCDLNRQGEPQAYGFGQVWHWCTGAWGAVPGSYVSIQETAQCVATRWVGAKYRCAGALDSTGAPIDTWAGAFSGYRANRCDWPDGAKRARKFHEIRRELQNLVKQPA
jgi:hypothetical protein